MKRSRSVILAVVSFFLLSGFLFNDPVEKDFINYVEVSMLNTQPDELEIFDTYCATLAGDYKNQLEMMSRVLDKTLIPKVDKVNEMLASIYPGTIEIKAVHDNKVESFLKLKEHLAYLKKALEKYIVLKDSALDMSIKASAMDFARHYKLWMEQLIYYSVKYKKDVVLKDHKYCLATLKYKWDLK